MALFSRRILQVIINESAGFLTREQVALFCEKLNSVRDDYLATEWELVLLNCFSKAGALSYEPRMSGPTRPDVLLNSPRTGDELIADITTISDKGLHDKNPYEALVEELFRRVRKRNLIGIGGFEIKIGKFRKVLRGSGWEERLMLPERQDFASKLFNQEFDMFLDRIRDLPRVRREVRILREDTDVQFTFIPGRKTSTLSSLSFDYTGSIDQNPLYNALRAKAGQLKRTGYCGTCGIFVADGGCRLLSRNRSRWGWHTGTEIVNHFLNSFKSISFVVLINIEPSFIPGRMSPHLRLFTQPGERKDPTFVTQVVQKIEQTIPTIQNYPDNALRLLKRRGVMSGRYVGRITMSAREIKVSGRMLLEVLAGERTIAEFESEFGITAADNPFRRMFAQGRPIAGFSVERLDAEDDDWITIAFGDPDPALGPFRLPRS